MSKIRSFIKRTGSNSLAFTLKVVLTFFQKVVIDSCGEQAEQQSKLLPWVNNVAIWPLRRPDNH